MARISDMEEQSGPAPVVEATRARAGMRGVHILWVLIISLALAILGLIVLFAVNAVPLGGPGGQTRAPFAVDAPNAPARQK